MGADPVIIKSPADHRVYKSLELPNGLRAILIHDPKINASNSCEPAVAGGENLDHKEIVDDDVGSVEMSGSESEGSESGSEGEESGSEEEEEHEHVRPHHPRALHGDGGVKKAAAALSVGIGHYSDPEHLQGLSHYLEHMLFMGSEKYPDENDYDSYLSANSGSSNACTEEEATTYHFDCAPQAFEGALDRFAQFFVAPLIKADALEREVKAVDNEFSGVLQSDACRQLQLRAHTARKDHPARKFGWGNRKSLVEDPAAAEIDVRAELLRHYKEQYSAERMNLVVLSGETIETLESWVKEKFSAVASGRGPRPRYTSCGFPFSYQNSTDGTALGQLSVLPAVRDEHRLSVIFQLPCLEKEYKKKAEDYLSHLIGHEGRGSLLAGLKSRGYATELCAGVADQTSAAWLFEVTITLTESGLNAGSGCGLAAAEVLFQYLAMLRAAGPQKWAWDEMAAIADMKWRFLEEEDAAEYAAQLASDMHAYPVEHALVGSYLHQDFDPGLISSLLESMSTQGIRLDLLTKNFEQCKGQLEALIATEMEKNAESGDGAAVEAGEEPWFNFSYVTTRLPKSLVEKWKIAPCPEDLSLPPPNPYLPTDFALKCEQTDENAAEKGAEAMAVDEIKSAFPSPPKLVLDDQGLSVWHKMDSTFKVPRTNAYFRLSLPAAYASPRAAALTHLVVKLMEDALCQEAYLADVADLHYSVWFEGASGVDIKVDGFSQKLSLLSTLVFQTLAALQFTHEDCSRVHESLVRQYRNANMKPLKHANYLRLKLLKAQMWPIEAVRAELESATAAAVRAFLPTLLHGAHIESLIFGNVTSKEACAIAEAARAALGAVAAALPNDRTLHLPEPSCSLLLRASVINPEEENSAIESYFQCGPSSDPRLRAVLDFIDQLVYEPCYDTLRTKEQLGYTVSSGPRLTHGIAGLCIIIQSGVYGPAHLDARADAFLSSFLDKLRNMDDAEFEKNREALLANKLMADRNLSEEAEKAWDGIVNRGQDFSLREKEVAAIRELSKAEVLQYFEAKFAPDGKERRKIAVYVAGKAHAADLEAAAVPKGAQVVTDIEGFKKDAEFYPAVAPQIAKS